MKQSKNNKSFSLIEIAIAIALLALIFGGMLAVFDRGAIAARKTQQQAVAYGLARAFLEQYSNWGGLASNGTYSLGSNILNNITYATTLTISDGPINPTQLKRLDITVSWIDGVTPRNVTIATLKANY